MTLPEGQRPEDQRPDEAAERDEVISQSGAMDAPSSPPERPAPPSQPADANPLKQEAHEQSTEDAAAATERGTSGVQPASPEGSQPAESAPQDPLQRATAEGARTNVGTSGVDPLRPDASAPPASDDQPVQEELTAEQKLADPGGTGQLPSEPAASVEKTAESAAPAPEGAQPQDPAAKAKPAAKAAKPAAERPARPAREEAKGPARETPPAGSINELFAAALPDVPLTAYTVPDVRGDSVAVEVPRDALPQVMTAARNDERLNLDYLRCLSGVDWQDEGLEVVYHLWSMSKRHGVTIKTRCPIEDPIVPSVASIYPAADWHEREARDMFGIVFDGHPNLVPLLLPEDMTDHFPLRKDNPLQEIEEWQGENLVAGAEGDEE